MSTLISPATAFAAVSDTISRTAAATSFGTPGITYDSLAFAANALAFAAFEAGFPTSSACMPNATAAS